MEVMVPGRHVKVITHNAGDSRPRSGDAAAVMS